MWLIITCTTEIRTQGNDFLWQCSIVRGLVLLTRSVLQLLLAFFQKGFSCRRCIVRLTDWNVFTLQKSYQNITWLHWYILELFLPQSPHSQSIITWHLVGKAMKGLITLTWYGRFHGYIAACKQGLQQYELPTEQVAKMESDSASAKRRWSQRRCLFLFLIAEWHCHLNNWALHSKIQSDK